MKDSSNFLNPRRLSSLFSLILQTHQGNCPQEMVWCENKCGARLQRRFLNNHMRNECHKRTSSCPYCQKQFMYETLQVCIGCYCMYLMISICFFHKFSHTHTHTEREREREREREMHTDMPICSNQNHKNILFCQECYFFVINAVDFSSRTIIINVPSFQLYVQTDVIQIKSHVKMLSIMYKHSAHVHLCHVHSGMQVASIWLVKILFLNHGEMLNWYIVMTLCHNVFQYIFSACALTLKNTWRKT